MGPQLPLWYKNTPPIWEIPPTIAGEYIDAVPVLPPYWCRSLGLEPSTVFTHGKTGSVHSLGNNHFLRISADETLPD